MKNKRKKYGSLQNYKKICAEIYEERNRSCEGCGVYITEIRYHNFHHEKDRRENFLNKDTIKLFCFVCHSKAEGINEKSTWLN